MGIHCKTCTCTPEQLDPNRPWYEHPLIDLAAYGKGAFCPAEYNVNDEEGLSCLIEGHHRGRPHECWIGPFCAGCFCFDTHPEWCPTLETAYMPTIGAQVRVLFTGDRPDDVPTYWVEEI